MIADILVYEYEEVRFIREQLKRTPYIRDGPNNERNSLLRKLRHCVGPKYRLLRSHVKRSHDVKFYSLVLDYIRKSG